jgi:hypothetical protein
VSIGVRLFDGKHSLFMMFNLAKFTQDTYLENRSLSQIEEYFESGQRRLKVAASISKDSEHIIISSSQEVPFPLNKLSHC